MPRWLSTQYFLVSGRLLFLFLLLLLLLLLLIWIFLLLSRCCSGPVAGLTVPPDPSWIEWPSIIKWKPTVEFVSPTIKNVTETLVSMCIHKYDRVYFRKARYACDTNEKGLIVVNWGQFVVNSPKHRNLSFWSMKIFEKGYFVVVGTECNVSTNKAL